MEINSINKLNYQDQANLPKEKLKEETFLNVLK